VGKPSELLMSERFNEIIQQVSKYYDAVVIDTAPILAVTDGVIVAKHAGINFLLIGSGMHHAEEIEFAVKRLYANNIKIQGVIYNNVHTESGAYGYGKYRYRYYYNYENA
jgi:tyrosine-protein kinase Etk/Wzc